MAPLKQTLTIYQGSTWSLELQHKDEDGADIPASDVTAVRMQARSEVDSSTKLLDLDDSSEITVSDGLITVDLTAAETEALSTLDMVYDLEVDYVDGTTERLIQGHISLDREVTR